jgi:hypothetical protein
MAETEPDRMLYLAITEEVFIDIFEEPIGKLMLDKQQVRLLVFDPTTEVIRLWKPISPIGT